jgi:hypothetical protein
MGVVLEEADEAILWLELITESGILPLERTETADGSERVDGDFCGFAENRKECGVDFSIAQLPDHSIAKFL